MRISGRSSSSISFQNDPARMWPTPSWPACSSEENLWFVMASFSLRMLLATLAAAPFSLLPKLNGDGGRGQCHRGGAESVCCCSFARHEWLRENCNKCYKFLHKRNDWISWEKCYNFSKIVSMKLKTTYCVTILTWKLFILQRGARQGECEKHWSHVKSLCRWGWTAVAAA